MKGLGRKAGPFFVYPNIEEALRPLAGLVPRKCCTEGLGDHEVDIELKALARMPVGPADRLTTGKNARKRGTGKVLLGDKHGRLFLVDPRAARVVEF